VEMYGPVTIPRGYPSQEMHGTMSFIQFGYGILLILVASTSLSIEPNRKFPIAPVEVLLILIFHSRIFEIFQDLLGSGYDHAIHILPAKGLTRVAIEVGESMFEPIVLIPSIPIVVRWIGPRVENMLFLEFLPGGHFV